MKNGLLVFLAAFIALGSSWAGFVLAPAIQLGGQKNATVLNGSDQYPIQRTGAATLGLQVYRANGCAACHTEQVRQDGFACNVVVTDPGKTPTNVSNLIASLKLDGLTHDDADAAAAKITAAGGKSETRLVATGVDIARGWGLRQSVAADFLYDYPVQLGALRVGPDLANVGVRLPDANWHYNHLYAPKSVAPNSTMPSFKFLFAVQKKVGGVTSAEALNLPSQFAPADGYEVVPTEAARELVAYLMSLKANVPLYEAPFSPVTTAKP
jgi:cbb3-type cytochrome oxidase cytochrome c subunit